MSTEHAPFGLPFPADQAPKKILIVEDHGDARQMLSFALRKLGFEVLSTASGAGALTVAQEKKPAVVLLDIGLADGPNGLQVCEKIKKKNGDASPYVIITSGRKDQATMEEARQCGADAYLVKPFRLSRLLEIVSSASTGANRFIVEMQA